jgi:hypothetical protein
VLTTFWCCDVILKFRHLMLEFRHSTFYVRISTFYVRISTFVVAWQIKKIMQYHIFFRFPGGDDEKAFWNRSRFPPKTQVGIKLASGTGLKPLWHLMPTYIRGEAGVIRSLISYPCVLSREGHWPWNTMTWIDSANYLHRFVVKEHLKRTQVRVETCCANKV